MQTPRLLRFVGLLVLTALFGSAQEKRPNILFCIADDWGWPHASAYANDTVVQTPAFDLVAREGALFHNAYISSPSCTPSRNAILTGQYHWRLGPGANLWSTLNQDLETFPHLLEDAGYETGSWRKSWGPGKLLGKWAERHPAGEIHKGGFPEFLAARDTEKPFFFWLGASDPHRGYKKGTGVESGMDISKIKLFGHYPDSDEVRSDVADYYFEVERFDSDVAEALKQLEATGEADNTIVVITGDHGMPFPRCKSNLYDSGTRVPLAIRWPNKMKSRQVLNGFVSLTDLAPTFLAAAGIKRDRDMTGINLLPAILDGDESRLRQYVLVGKERHVPSQRAPDMGGYPSRALRTPGFLYIRNYTHGRGPNGIADWENAAISGTWYGDTDNGPTKTYMVDNKDKDDEHRRAYELSFGPRPAEELYDLRHDPDQLNNLAGDPNYASILNVHALRLTKDLIASGDPRESDSHTFDFDAPPYYGGGPRHPDAPPVKK
ncbi:MAG: sulfatase [Synoicihabitans sp.]